MCLRVPSTVAVAEHMQDLIAIHADSMPLLVALTSLCLSATFLEHGTLALRRGYRLYSNWQIQGAAAGAARAEAATYDFSVLQYEKDTALTTFRNDVTVVMNIASA